jgi:hypothetical protein
MKAVAPFQRVMAASIGKWAIGVGTKAGAVRHFNAGNFNRR